MAQAMINDILHPGAAAPQEPATYSPGYLSKFTPSYLDWLRISEDLEMGSQGAVSIPLKCRTSLHNFKTAYTDKLPVYSC